MLANRFEHFAALVAVLVLTGCPAASGGGGGGFGPGFVAADSTTFGGDVSGQISGTDSGRRSSDAVGAGQDATCKPECADKECGDDGCGGKCGVCPAVAPVCAAGKCATECKSNCANKECGSDGCDGTCGKCPGAAPTCVEGTCKATASDCGNGQCDTGESPSSCPQDCKVGCTPVCNGQSCGEDGCGKQCVCASGQTCDANKDCVSATVAAAITIAGVKDGLVHWAGQPDPEFYGFLQHLFGKKIADATKVNNFMEMTLANAGSMAVDASVEVAFAGYSETFATTESVPAKGSKVFVVPFLVMNNNFKTLNAPLTVQLQVKVVVGGAIVQAKSQPVSLYPRNHVYWGKIPWVDADFSGQDAVVTLVTPSSPAIQEVLATAQDYSALKSMVGYQCATGYEYGKGKLPVLYADLAPGGNKMWQVWHDDGDVVSVNVAVTCSVCLDYNAAYVIEDADGKEMWSSWTLGKAVAAVSITKSGWYKHWAMNPASNSSNRQFTVKRAMTASECATDQLSAIYLGLQDYGFKYTTVGNTFFSGAQFVKPIEKTWSDKAGNCIDGTILFAAGLEAMGMQPLLAYPKGHALVGVRCNEGLPCLVPIETTAIGSGTTASQAIQGAVKTWATALATSDVYELRKLGFSPAP